MGIWNILEIEPTSDKNTIKRAYHKKLPEYNPEDNPEGFKKLRTAYEEALKESENINEEEENKTLPEWMEEFMEIYNTFSRRIDINEWKNFLKRDEFFSLDMRDEIRIKTFGTFLYNASFVPNSVLALFNRELAWKENEEELSKVFPEKYLKMVFQRIEDNDDIIDYSMFKDIDNSRNYDEWLKKFLYLENAFSRGDYKEWDEDYKWLKNSGIYHPYLNVEFLRYLLNTKKILDDQKQTEEVIRKVLKEVTKNGMVYYYIAEAAYQWKDYENAAKFYGMASFYGKENENLAVKSLCCQIECYIKLGDNEDAEDIYFYLKETKNYCDDELENLMFKASRELIKERKEKFYAVPDCRNFIKYAENCLFLEKADELLEASAKIAVIKKENSYKVHFCRGQALELKKMYLQALNEYKTAFFAAESTKEQLKNKYVQFKCRALLKCAEICLKMKNYSETEEYIEKIYNADINFPGAFNLQIKMYFQLKDYNKIINALNEKIHDEERIKDISDFKMQVYFFKEAGRYREAEEAAEIIEYIDSLNAKSYENEMDLLILMSDFEGAEKCFERAYEKGVKSNLLNIYKGIVYVFTGRLKEAEAMAGKAEKEIKNLPETEKAEFYFLKSQIEFQKRNIEKGKDFLDMAAEINPSIKICRELGEFYMYGDASERALEVYREMSEKNPFNPEGLKGCAKVYKYNGRIDEALAAYKKAEKKFPDDYVIWNEIAQLEMLKENYREALSYFEKLKEYAREDYFYYNRGLCYEKLDMTEAAEKDYIKASDEHGKYALSAIKALSGIYFKKGSFAKAAEILENAAGDYEDEFGYEEELVNIYDSLYSVYFKLSNYRLAESYLQLGLAKFENSSKLILRKGEYLIFKEKYYEAETCLKRALKNSDDKEASEILLKLGEIYCKHLNDIDEGIKYLKKALVFSPEDLNLIKNIADAYMEKNDLKNAGIYRNWYKKYMKKK